MKNQFSTIPHSVQYMRARKNEIPISWNDQS
jgi:hypothetical protein